MRVFVGRLHSVRGVVSGLVAAIALAVAAPARAQAPDFDAVAWTGVGCPAADLVRHTTPAGVDLAGDATFPAIYIAHDSDYAYLRYRVDGDPSGPGGCPRSSSIGRRVTRASVGFTARTRTGARFSRPSVSTR